MVLSFKLFLKINKFYMSSMVCFKIYLLNEKFKEVKKKLENYMQFNGRSYFNRDFRSWKEKENDIMFNFIYFLCFWKFYMFFFHFFKPVKTTFTYSLKIVFYFTLFLKTIFREQLPNDVRNFLKQITIFKLHNQTNIYSLYK